GGVMLFQKNKNVSILGNIVEDVWSNISGNIGAINMALVSDPNLANQAHIDGNILKTSGVFTATYLNRYGFRSHSKENAFSTFGRNDFSIATAVQYSNPYGTVKLSGQAS